ITAARPDSATVPLFCVAAPFVNSLGYVAVGRHLGPDQPVYLLQSRYRDNEDRPYSREELSGLAVESIRAMRTVRAEGPYCLAAMCEGIHIVFEMARQLQDAGEEVSLLVSFDAWPEENTRSRFGWWRHRCGTWIHRGVRTRSITLSTALRRIAGTTVRAFGHWALRPIRPPTPDSWEARYWPGRGFKPEQFRGTIIVFRVARQRVYRIRRRDLGWTAWATEGVEVHDVPGDHRTMLREPNVQEVSAILGRYLYTVQDRLRRETGDG